MIDTPLYRPGGQSGLPTSNSPAVNAAGAFSGMDENRESELLRAIPRLRCAGEVEGFRWWLNETGEKPTGPVEAALVVQEDKLK